MEFKKKDLILKEDKSEEGIIQKVLSKLKGIRDRAKSEVEETRGLVRILTHAVRSYSKTREFDLDEKDKEFIKGQSGDVVKNMILVIISIIPIPIPVTPFLVIFGKKIGIDFIPKQQDIPEKGKKKEKYSIDENKKIKFFRFLHEQITPENEDTEDTDDFINQLCKQSIDRKLKSTTFCDLLKYYDQTDAKEKTLNSVKSIYNFFVVNGKGLNVGTFPKIIKIALNSNDPAHYLYIVSEFILDKNLEKGDDEIKEKLKKYRGRDIAPLNLEVFLERLRGKKYSEYEDSLTKNELSLNRTMLTIPFNCEDDVDTTLIELLKQIKHSSPEEKLEQFENIFKKVTDCMLSFMNSDDKVIKADAIYNLDKPMTYDNKEIIKPGDYIEIKMMDPEVDSYLSEFFSIFKQTNLAKYKKKEYILIYNYFIDRLFDWVLKNGGFYLQKVIDSIVGVIYDKNLFVPKDQIDIYWSNMGQRGCNERRLSIRFRLKPELKTMTGYVYDPGKEEKSLVRTEVRNLPNEFRERKVCRETFFDISDESYITKDEYKKKEKNKVTESTKPLKLIITKDQYNTLLGGLNKKRN